jgi:hypothetical protein
MSLTTPETIRTLQRKFYTKAKQEPAYRFYALYDKVYRDDILRHAWSLVRSNAGSPGIDGVSFEAIEQGEGVEGFLKDITEDLREKRYRAQPLRRVMIPGFVGGLITTPDTLCRPWRGPWLCTRASVPSRARVDAGSLRAWRSVSVC